MGAPERVTVEPRLAFHSAAIGAEVISMEAWLETSVAGADEMLGALMQARLNLAARLHGIRVARSPEVAAAAQDLAEREAAGRPYEDAASAEDLVASLRARLAAR